MRLTKYIYFAVNNITNSPYFQKSFIIGETDDIHKRQEDYQKIGKGMFYPQTGNIKNFCGKDGYMFPFVDYFLLTLDCKENAKNIHDKKIHEIMASYRPLKDLCTPIKDNVNFKSKEGFKLNYEGDILDSIQKIKSYIFDYMQDSNLIVNKIFT